MKILFCLTILTIAVVAQALTDEPDEKREKLRNKCSLETGVSLELVDKARRGEEVDVSQLGKYLICAVKTAGLVNESGDLDADQLRIKVRRASKNDEEADKVMEKCAVKKDTLERASLSFFKCIIKEQPNFSPA